MTKQVIATGTAANDGTGTPLRDAFTYVNGNFTELYDPDDDWIAGQYFAAHDYVTLSAGTAPVNTTMYLVPIKIRRTITLSTIATFLTTAQASQLWAVGLYANNKATNRPTGNPIASSAFTLSTATANVLVDGAFTANVQLSPGKYWIAFQSNATTAIWQNAPASWAGVSKMIGDSTSTNVVVGTSAVLQTLTIANTFGTWPDVTSATFTFNQSSRGAAFYLKAASVP